MGKIPSIVHLYRDNNQIMGSTSMASPKIEKNYQYVGSHTYIFFLKEI